ncbi:hypothetical protein AVEN_262262-1 [Araneus ventricosus]|uniref:Uncharacterized protein n=1 Tax=Araneus ventricosus TaxID=182803 RepID=A0A4Y2NKA0_ARAVE|nr:hypothetical protein AVEN_262262-1 [Araneus ventricosus]
MRWEIQLSQNHTLQAPTTPQWPSVKVSNSKPMGPRFETRFHCRSTEHMNLVYTKSDFVGQTVSLECIADAWRGVSAQVSSSSSDRGSKLQDPSQNSSLSSKRNLNITD